jgi:hypothetical protein
MVKKEETIKYMKDNFQVNIDQEWFYWIYVYN